MLGKVIDKPACEICRLNHPVMKENPLKILMMDKERRKQIKYKSMQLKVQKMIEKLLPEPQPNSEPLLIGLPSATLAQNALLGVRQIY